MKFIRNTARYSLLDHKRNEVIFEELKGDAGENKLAEHKQNCFKTLDFLGYKNSCLGLLDYHTAQ
jgi:hypothetical protein